MIDGTFKLLRAANDWESNQLILDLAEAVEPGCLKLSNKETEVSVMTSSIITHVSLELFKGNVKREVKFDLIESSGVAKILSMNEQPGFATPDFQTCVRLLIASAWLEECVKKHPSCIIPDPHFMPRRLIDVGCEGSDPFLIDSKVRPAPYAALSYCWGDVQNTITTRRENLLEHQKRIPYILLPKTLKDAVIVCRRMRVQYLWIDALCIIQDDIDEEDWYTESGNMRHIYSNSLFTIAAENSVSCAQGFLQRPSEQQRWRTFSEATRSARHRNVLFKTSSPEVMDSSALLSSALSRRGWALQECILPIRILHFTAKEMVWECNHDCQCECGSKSYDLARLTCQGISSTRPQISSFAYDSEKERSTDIVNFLSRRTVESVCWSWRTLVEYYTQRHLTNHADKLSALSGLAQVALGTQGFGGGPYLAGLWRGDLVIGLLWHVRGPSEPQRYTEYQAPTWSWASINGSVKYFAEHYQFIFEENVSILEAECEVSPLDPTGRVKAGHLLLNSGLVPVKVLVEGVSPHEARMRYIGYNGEAGRTFTNQQVYVQDENHQFKYEVLPDERMDYGEQRGEYYCLKIGSHSNRYSSGTRVWWLVLKKRAAVVEGETCVFERVGIGYKFTSFGFLDLFGQHTATKTIKLV